MRKWLWTLLLTAAVMICLLPAAALAAQTTLCIDKGDITIGDGTVSGYDAGGNLVTTPNPEGYLITQENGNTAVTDYYIVVTGGTHSITLQNVNIDRSGTVSSSAFALSNNANVTLTLSGVNRLTSGNYCAGLQVPAGTIITIQGTDADSLTAQGGSHGAGIGSGNRSAGGTVNISGGTVTANGGYNGAGIGGGNRSAGGTVNISGGTVTANGGYSGAGIGSGSYITPGIGGGTVNISGGTVTATGGMYGAGIGGGGFTNGGSGGGDGGTVFITGGSVKATGKDGGADIGAGAGNNSHGTLTNGTTNGNQPLELVTVTLTGAVDGTPVASFITNPGYYGMKDVVTMDSGKLYLYLPTTGHSIQSATTGETTPRLFTRSTADTSTTVTLSEPTYTYNPPVSITENGVTAAVTYSPASPQPVSTSIIATVTLTGTATVAGAHTINLNSATASLTGTEQNITVTAGQNLTTTPITRTFSFTMPAQNVDDLTLTHTFAATPIITFTTQPVSSTSVTFGSITGNLTAAAAVAPSDTVSLNWYTCDASGTPSGYSLATGGTFPIPTALTAGTYYFLCQATARSATTVNSNVATVTVTAAADPTISISPNATFQQGNAPITTLVIGEGLSNFNATNNFDSISVDGTQLTLSTNTVQVSNGSIRLQFSPLYLNTLSVGSHTVAVALKGGAYTGRTVSTTLTVTQNVPVVIPPKTGDSANPMLWLGLMLLGGTGLVALCIRRKRRA